MNPLIHSKISVANRKGIVDDYFPIHFFMDSTKEICSDNRHRILHNLWGIRRVIIPIFGKSFINSDGKEVSVKDLCEQDHILPDYNQKFIPTLGDFVDELLDLSTIEKKRIDAIYDSFSFNTNIQELLISPLNITGQLKGLRITHSIWFINQILPKIFSLKPRTDSLIHIPIFDGMKFKSWMDNGTTLPKSALNLKATNEKIHN